MLLVCLLCFFSWPLRLWKADKNCVIFPRKMCTHYEYPRFFTSFQGIHKPSETHRGTQNNNSCFNSYYRWRNWSSERLNDMSKSRMGVPGWLVQLSPRLGFNSVHDLTARWALCWQSLDFLSPPLSGHSFYSCMCAYACAHSLSKKPTEQTNKKNKTLKKSLNKTRMG